MKSQILYFILFLSGFCITAQTAPTPTVEFTLPQPIIQSEPAKTYDTATALPATNNLVIDTAKQIPVQTSLKPIPTQTLRPVQIVGPNPNGRSKKRKETLEKENKEITALYKQLFDKNQEIILQNKRYRIYNNYLTAGVGKCYNSGWKYGQPWQLSTAIDYNFHIQKMRFQTGFLLAGPTLGDNSCIQFHAGYGYRFERCNYHWAAYGSLSYTDGYRLEKGYLQNIDTTYKVKLSAIGVYANLQFYYKLKFDYGLGVSAFIDANNKQVLSGIRVEFFFSGAYKGLKKINYAKEDEINNRN